MQDARVNILLVDDQPAKLLSYRSILLNLGENLLEASSAREALDIILRREIAVVLIDVCMPETDGFELAAMIRNHPRFEKIAIIFISAVLLTEMDRLHGYEMGAVDYVPVPVIPEVLRAKVKIFVELYRKTRELEVLNRELEGRVAERTAALAQATAQLRQSERLRSLALAAGQMGSWEWDAGRADIVWDLGQHEIFGVDPAEFQPTLRNIKPLIHPDDFRALRKAAVQLSAAMNTLQCEFRVTRPEGELRWCVGVVAASFDEAGRLLHMSGVTVDITDRKRAEERLLLLAREVDHRARNVVAVIQSIMRLTRADNIDDYMDVLDGRIRALATAHKLLANSRWEGADVKRLVEEEAAPYQAGDTKRFSFEGPDVLLAPAMAQTIALALHELVTNSAKYGALSSRSGMVRLKWRLGRQELEFSWTETGGPRVKPPTRQGYGIRVITAGIEGQLRGTAHFDWRSEGLCCTLRMPHQGEPVALVGEGDPPDLPSIELLPSEAEPPSEGRILLVEDEPLVWMMLADTISDLGYSVAGPYSGVAEAARAAREEQIAGGILDVNLAGELVYPVAEELQQRGIPFVFLTGYGPDSIEPRFSGAPVVQKPVQPREIAAFLAATCRRPARRRRRSQPASPGSLDAGSPKNGATTP